MERSATCSSRREVTKNGVSVLTHFAELSRTVKADQVQLQRVILNLIINAVEAMSGMREEPRELPICTEKEESTAGWWRCEIRVRDWIRRVDRLFEAFYTTVCTSNIAQQHRPIVYRPTADWIYDRNRETVIRRKPPPSFHRRVHCSRPSMPHGRRA
jgi:hypothetical protein